MSITIYRIVKRKWAEVAFDGEGASAYPGRWNNRGTAIIYAASTRSLAHLEILVNFETEDLLREQFIIFPMEVPENCMLELGINLPDDWQDTPIPASTRSIGDDWANNQASTVLIVPSTIIPAESNYLINPEHPDYEAIIIAAPEEISFDTRLLK